jgi:peptidoglycan/xylan/chitin deacetylase (PgdA/CDA1 family)
MSRSGKEHAIFCGWPHAVRRALPWLLAIAMLLGSGGGASAQGQPKVAVSHRPTGNGLSAADQADLARNWRMGCLGHAPAPLGHAIRSGVNPASGHPAPREVALTFDDGPTPYTTPPILDFLEKTHTPATFFVIGQYAATWPDLIRREWRSGFAIGVHTWNHPYMTRISYGAAQAQFVDTMNAITRAIGGDPCIWFWRPPYMDQNAQVIGHAASLGLTTIDWDDDTRDWSRPGVQAIANTALSEAHPGAIVIMHDGPANREETLAALPLILAGLKARGLTPVTVPQLLMDGGYTGVRLPSGQEAPLWRVPAMVHA